MIKALSLIVWTLSLGMVHIGPWPGNRGGTLMVSDEKLLNRFFKKVPERV